MTPEQAANVIRALAHAPGVPAEVFVSYAALVAADVSEAPDPGAVPCCGDCVARCTGRCTGCHDLTGPGDPVTAASALRRVGLILDSWARQDVEEQEARGVRDRVTDPELVQLYPSDVRSIIADAARELGVTL